MGQVGLSCAQLYTLVCTLVHNHGAGGALLCTVVLNLGGHWGNTQPSAVRPIGTCLSHIVLARILPQIARIPRGFGTMLPRSLLGAPRKPRRRPGVRHGQWSGLPGPEESDQPVS